MIPSVLAKLASENTPLSEPLSNEQISWIASFNSIGALFGSISIGWIIHKLGCKRAMFALAFPFIIFWILVYFGKNFYFILVARFINGFTGGCTQVYICNACYS